ncbi:hypothetical protein [Streptomyces sp. NPDC051554]|uniref:hypothetical protein n=1 Tax=Streptomyces sp. NPDC051554 TaxID=3365656 RepID=UPI0037AA3B2E
MGVAGELVVRDADGLFRFVDRTKEVIRRRGENVSSQEVESVVHSHPAVADAAAFPVPRCIDTVRELPLTETGKVRKGVLRERGVTATTWDRSTPSTPARHLT